MPDLPEIELNIETDIIVAKNHKLKDTWRFVVSPTDGFALEKINLEFEIKSKKLHRSIDDDWEVSKID